MYRMYCMVASRIKMLALSRKDRFTRRNVFAKCDKINGRIWESLGASFVKNKATLEKNSVQNSKSKKQLQRGFNISRNNSYPRKILV